MPVLLGLEPQTTTTTTTTTNSHHHQHTHPITITITIAARTNAGSRRKYVLLKIFLILLMIFLYLLTVFFRYYLLISNPSPPWFTLGLIMGPLLPIPGRTQVNTYGDGHRRYLRSRFQSFQTMGIFFYK